MKNVLLASRVYRTLHVLMIMLVASAFAKKITIEIMFLGICCILTYSAASIHNAILDEDYILPKYSKFIIAALILLSFFISLVNLIVFFTNLFWIILGYIYNSKVRFLLFGDSTLLAITHFAMPLFSSCLLLDVTFNENLKLTISMYILFWFIIQVKNLKDTRKDYLKKYKTLTTVFRNGNIFSAIFLCISFTIMFLLYFIFDLSVEYLWIMVVIFILYVIAVVRIIKSHGAETVKILRLITLVFFLGLILEWAVNTITVFFSFLIVIIYTIIVFIMEIRPKDGAIETIVKET